MKKISILALCLVAGLGATAQKSVVKEAEKAMKGNKPFTEVVTIITPAFSDPTTEKLAETYYIPGKAGFNQYNDMLGKRSLGQDVDTKVMAEALIGGYGYFMKALPLDSLPNEKGKVSPKYSKKILSEIAGHMTDFSNAAVDMWNNKDYKGAYHSWGIYLDIAKDPRYNKMFAAVPDSVMSNISYNQALAAWQAEDYPAAIKSFNVARKYGYNGKQLFEYGIAVASNAKDFDAVLDFAQAGNKLFGKEDPQFLNHIINYYLQTEKYEDALSYLDNGINEDPSNAQYYALRGIIYDNKKEAVKARVDYEKALQLDPNNGLALFYEGRSIASEAGAQQDAYDKADYEKFKKENIDPKFREAVTFLEKAYEVDPTNRAEALKVLEILYYNLNDENGLNSVKDRKALLD